MGKITGLDTGIGALLGMLLRGYTTGQREEDLNQLIQQQAQGLGLPQVPYEQSSYINRMLDPQGSMQQLTLRKALLDQFQEQLLKTEGERAKQGFIGQHRLATQGLANQGRMDVQGLANQGQLGVQGMRGEQGMAQQTLVGEQAMRRHTTPQAAQQLDPSQIGLNQARAQEAQAQAGMAKNMQDLFARIYGAQAGAIPGDIAPPAGGAPSPGAAGGGFEYGPPTLGMTPHGPSLSMAPQETIGRKVETTRQETRAREEEQARMASGPTNKMIEAIDALTSKLNTQTDPIAARAPGTVNWLGAKTGMSDVATSYEALKTAYRGVLSRSVASERGVLTQQDIENVTAAWPGYTDTTQRRDFKIGMFKQLLRSSQDPNADPGAVKQLVIQLIAPAASPQGIMSPEQELEEYYRGKGMR